jgi:hypothetical protein
MLIIATARSKKDPSLRRYPQGFLKGENIIWKRKDWAIMFLYAKLLVIT